MAQIYTDNMVIKLPQQQGQQYSNLVEAIEQLEELSSGLVSVDVTAGDVALSTAQMRAMFIKAIGSPGVSRAITFPAGKTKSCVLINAVGDSSNVSFESDGAGNSITLAPGGRVAASLVGDDIDPTVTSELSFDSLATDTAVVDADDYLIFKKASDGTSRKILAVNLLGAAARSWAAIQTFAAGIVSGTVWGSVSSAGDINLRSTSHATKGKIYLGGSYVDETTGRLMITNIAGLSITPEESIHSVGEGTNSGARIIERYYNSANGTFNKNRKSRGTYATPITVNDDDQIHTDYQEGHDGTDWRSVGWNRWETDAAPTGGVIAGRYRIATMNPSGSEVDALYIDSLQRTGLGGVTSPLAYLHLPAGATAAGKAALKMTSGSVLTTPEAGAWEFDGSHVYFTIGSTRYQIDQQGGGATPTGTGWVHVTGGVQDGAASTPTASDVGLGSVTNHAQLKASDLDTDGTLAANSDTKIASQKAVKTYVDTAVAAGGGNSVGGDIFLAMNFI